MNWGIGVEVNAQKKDRGVTGHLWFGPGYGSIFSFFTLLIQAEGGGLRDQENKNYRKFPQKMEFNTPIEGTEFYQ